MDRIQFIVSQDHRIGGVTTSINGRPLIELLAEHESPFAFAEGHPEVAGAYMGRFTMIGDRVGGGRPGRSAGT